MTLEENLEVELLAVDKELKDKVERAKTEARAKRKKLREKAKKKFFSNGELLVRELKKRGVKVEKPFYTFSSEEVVELAEKLAPKLVEKVIEEPDEGGEDFELDFDN